MKKKICCIAAEMFLAMALISACADGRQEAVGNMQNVLGQRVDEDVPSDTENVSEQRVDEDVPGDTENVSEQRVDEDVSGDTENVSKSREGAGSGAQESSDPAAEEMQGLKSTEVTPIAPDLNHNGRAEEVQLTDLTDGQGQLLEIWEDDNLLFRTEGYYVHSGQESVFLCTLDGKDYLLCYYPEMFQGVCTYGYQLLTLVDNRQNTEQWRGVDFDINFGSPVHGDFDAEAIADFMDEINDLLAHSVQLLNTNDELQGTFEKEGRLYDSLWWMDNQEPVFVRDESKPLQENLKDYQAAMTAVQEPPVPVEVNGLPITEPLEMVFCSGAGAWRTVINLNPDGSFVGEYSDADCNTIYVCQFHGRFGEVGKLTDNSWLLTLEELLLDTGYSVGEKWDVTEDGYTIHYISSDPYGFDGVDGSALKPGAQFILYSPNATGHKPGTELYGALEFRSWMWMYDRHEFDSENDTLGCWGLQNMEAGRGFFAD